MRPSPRHLAEDYTDEEIARNEATIHQQLRQITQSLPQVQSSFVIDRLGNALAASTVSPVPRFDVPPAADREFFLAMRRGGGPEIHVSAVYMGRVDKRPFFAVSKRRKSRGEQFNGLVNVSADPEYIASFYATLVNKADDSMSLLREDGEILARYPYSGRVLLPKAEWFVPVLASVQQQVAVLTSPGIDGVERLYTFRKLTGYPLYVVVGRSTAAIAAAWLSELAAVLGWALLGTLVLAGMTAFALREAMAEQRSGALAREEARRREAAESALRHSERMEALGRLTGGVVHDFNNVLAVLNGVLRLVAKRGANDEQLKLIQSGFEALTRAEELTGQLLAFSRKQPLKVETVDINGRLRELRDLVRHTLAESAPTVRIELDLADDVQPVRTDVSQLDLAILNLAANARDAMPNGGVLTLSTRNIRLFDRELQGEFVVVSVSDTGSGIAPEHLDRVFEPFFTTKPSGQGTGLGLSSVYGFAVQSGGKPRINPPHAPKTL